MPEFFDPGTAESMMKVIADLNSQWSEGIPPEYLSEVAKQGVSVYNNGKNVAVQYVDPNGLVKQLETSVENFPNTTASQALEAYKAAGGKVNYAGTNAVASNKIVSGGKVVTYEVAKTGGTKAAFGGILSMNLPTAAAAIAPVAGFALGTALYTSAPDFWEKISRALLPFCYDDTLLLPVMYDEDGTTYYPSEAIDAVKEVLGESATGGTVTSEIVDLSEYITPYPIPSVRVNRFVIEVKPTSGDKYYDIYEMDSSVNTIAFTSYDGIPGYMCASSSPFKNRSYTADSPDSPPPSWAKWSDSAYQQINGKPVYQSGLFAGTAGRDIFTPQLSAHIMKDMSTEVRNQLLYSIAYGTTMQTPDGISSWSGASYPTNAATIGLITAINADGSVVTEEYYPITTPTGEPGVSVNPTDTNDLTTNKNPSAAIDPWLVPDPAISTYPQGVTPSNPSPIPDDVPNYDPNLNPNDNPSEKPTIQPQPEPSTSNPTSSGTTTAPQNPFSPGISAAKGLVHVYNPTQSQIEAFGAWLWTTFSGDIIDTVSKLFNSPMDAVIGLHELYVKPNIAGTDTIKAGYLDSKVSSEFVGNRYSSLNCGSVVVPEWYQNYLDYSPYTKCFAYLPFIGIVPLAADDIVGGAINITYHVDSYTGCCIAILTTAREGYSATTYQFEGNCAVEVPITSGYQSTLIAGLLGLAGTAISGNPHVGLAASNLGRATLGKNEVSHSGSFGASYGAMGLKKPYIIVKRPIQKIAPNYNVLYGLPAHKVVTIGACSGYLRVREVHVQSPTATDEEKVRIEELLKEGVIVQ